MVILLQKESIEKLIGSINCMMNVSLAAVVKIVDPFFGI